MADRLVSPYSFNVYFETSLTPSLCGHAPLSHNFIKSSQLAHAWHLPLRHCPLRTELFDRKWIIFHDKSHSLYKEEFKSKIHIVVVAFFISGN